MYTAHQTQSELDWTAYRSVRNKIRSAIKSAKDDFYRRALSSKRSKNVWTIIHKILNPNPKRIRSDPDELNNFFATTSQRVLGVESPNTQGQILLPFWSLYRKTLRTTVLN